MSTSDDPAETWNRSRPWTAGAWAWSPTRARRPDARGGRPDDHRAGWRRLLPGQRRVFSFSTIAENDAAYRLFRPDLEESTEEDAAPIFQSLNAIPVPWVEPEDISAAMVFLCSEGARYITGETMAVAAGHNATNAA